MAYNPVAQSGSTYRTGAQQTDEQGRPYVMDNNGQRVYLSPRAVDGYADSGNPYQSGVRGGGGYFDAKTGQWKKKSMALENLTLAAALGPFAAYGLGAAGVGGAGGAGPSAVMTGPMAGGPASGFAGASSAAGLSSAGTMPGLIGSTALTPGGFGAATSGTMTLPSLTGGLPALTPGGAGVSAGGNLASGGGMLSKLSDAKDTFDGIRGIGDVASNMTKGRAEGRHAEAQDQLTYDLARERAQRLAQRQLIIADLMGSEKPITDPRAARWDPGTTISPDTIERMRTSAQKNLQGGGLTPLPHANALDKTLNVVGPVGQFGGVAQKAGWLKHLPGIGRLFS